MKIKKKYVKKYEKGGEPKKLKKPKIELKDQKIGNTSVQLPPKKEKTTGEKLPEGFGVEAAKKAVANKKSDSTVNKNDIETQESTKPPKEEGGRGNYHGGSDTPQVIRDKDIDRGRGAGSDDVDGDGDVEKPTRLSRDERARERQRRRDERFMERQARKDARNERRLERRRQRQNRRTFRKEQRQFRRTERRRQRQEKREQRGMTHTGGRRISPRRWYKNLRDKLGLHTNAYDRLKDYDEFKTSRTEKPTRKYKGGGMADSAAYEKGGTTKKPRQEKKRNWVQEKLHRYKTTRDHKRSMEKSKPYTEDQWYKGSYGHTRAGYQHHAPDWKQLQILERGKKSGKRSDTGQPWSEEDERLLQYARDLQKKDGRTSYQKHKAHRQRVSDAKENKYQAQKKEWADKDKKAKEQRKKDAKESSLKRSQNMKFGPKYITGGRAQVRQLKNQRYADKENQAIQQRAERKDLRKEQKAQRIEDKAAFRADKQRAKQTGALMGGTGSGSVGIGDNSMDSVAESAFKKGGRVRKYQYGGVRAINKEGKKHGASKEQMDYAKGLYKGASKGQQKQAMSMYKEYQRTGKIPEGAEELYESAGGDGRYFKRGGKADLIKRKRALRARSKNPGRKAFMGMVAKAAGGM